MKFRGIIKVWKMIAHFSNVLRVMVIGRREARKKVFKIKGDSWNNNDFSLMMRLIDYVTLSKLEHKQHALKQSCHNLNRNNS